MLTTIEPLSPEWHEFRRKRISATDVAKIIGVAPKSQGTAIEVWSRITGKVMPDDIPDSDEIAFGSLSEQLNATLFVRKHTSGGIPRRTVSRPGGFWVDDEFDWLCASPDGFVSDRERGVPGVWEAKAVSHGHAAWEDDEIPEHYLCQVFAQMRCTRLNWGCVSALMQPVVEVRDVELEPDFMNWLMERLIGFWENNVLKDVRPPVTDHERDKAALNAIHKPKAGKRIFLPPSMFETLDAYRSMKEKAKELEQEIALYENNVRALCVDAEAEEIVSPDGSCGWTYKIRKGYTRPESVVKAGYVLNPMKKVKVNDVE